MIKTLPAAIFLYLLFGIIHDICRTLDMKNFSVLPLQVTETKKRFIPFAEFENNLNKDQ